MLCVAVGRIVNQVVEIMMHLKGTFEAIPNGALRLYRLGDKNKGCLKGLKCLKGAIKGVWKYNFLINARLQIFIYFNISRFKSPTIRNSEKH